MRVILEPKLAGEEKVYEFPFDLPTGVTISSATVEVAVYSGVDLDPSNIVSGSASISGGTISQTFTGGVAGVLYGLICTAVRSDGVAPQASGFLAVIPAS